MFSATYLFHVTYGNNNRYIWVDKISATIKITVLSQNLCCMQRKQDRVIDTSFKFHGKYYAEKYTKRYFCGIQECLNEDAQKKKNMMLSVHPQVGMYESYGFNGDLRETIN